MCNDVHKISREVGRGGRGWGRDARRWNSSRRHSPPPAPTPRAADCQAHLPRRSDRLQPPVLPRRRCRRGHAAPATEYLLRRLSQRENEDRRPRARLTSTPSSVGSNARSGRRCSGRFRAGRCRLWADRRPDAESTAVGRELAGAARPCRGGRSESRAAVGPSVEPDRVRRGDPRAARPGDRRPRAVAGRRFWIRLRQQRRRPDHVAGAAGALPGSASTRSAVSRIGDTGDRRHASPDIQVSRLLRQDERMSDALPFGTRGGVADPALLPARRRIRHQVHG